MNSKYFISILSVSVLIACAESSPHSPANEAGITPNANSKKIKNSPNKSKAVNNRESEVEEIEPVGEKEAEFPPRRGLPYFPSLSLPHEEFKTELEKVMEHINAGLEKVMQSIHDVVHEGLNVLGGLDHDKAFITSFDPNLFKNKVRKYEEEQAARRRKKENNSTNS